jgi:RNA polymerase sigma-70 factor (ECF subfamily)
MHAVVEGTWVRRAGRGAPHSPLPVSSAAWQALGVNLEEVHASYGDWIRGKVRHYLRDAWEDGVQEVFVRLQPALERMRETRPEAVRALVSRTVRSVCIDEIRRRGRQLDFAPAAVATEPEELADPHATDAEHDELLPRVRELWNALPERDRRILKLRFQDGLSFREIAEVLDVPQGSVAGWYSRAVAQLREALP